MKGKTSSTEREATKIYLSPYLWVQALRVFRTKYFLETWIPQENTVCLLVLWQERSKILHPEFPSVETATFLRFHIVTLCLTCSYLNLARAVKVQLFCYHMLTYPTTLNCVLTKGLYCLLGFFFVNAEGGLWPGIYYSFIGCISSHFCVSASKVSKTFYTFLMSPYSSVKGAKSRSECEEEIFFYGTSGHLGVSAKTDFIGIYLRKVT